MAEPSRDDLREIEIRLPAFVPREDDGPPADLVGHVDMQLLSPQQRRGLQVLLTGLNRSHSRTDDGKHVDTAAQAVRWILERICDACESPEGRATAKAY